LAFAIDERERTRLVRDLAKNLPEKELGKVLDYVHLIASDDNRIRLLSTLVQCLPEDRLGRVLDISRTIRNEKARLEIMIALIQRIPKGEFLRILTYAQADVNDHDFARVLSALIERAPKEIHVKILDAIRSIDDKKIRTDLLNNYTQNLKTISTKDMTLTRLVHSPSNKYAPKSSTKLSPESIRKMLNTAQVIKRKGERYREINAITAYMAKHQAAEYYRIVDESICNLAQRTRANLFYDIAALLHVLVDIGNESIAGEIYYAMRDVSQWWK
jgi:hypothetical protein